MVVDSTLGGSWPYEIVLLLPVFSVTTLSRALKGELISFKLAHDIPAERNSDRIKAARKTYAEWMVDQFGLH